MTTLLRKAARDLWIGRWQAIGLTLLVAIMVTVGAGAIRARRVLAHTRDAWYEELKVADLEIRSSVTQPGGIERVRGVPGVAAAAEHLLLRGVLRAEAMRPLPAMVRVLPADPPAVNRLAFLAGRYPGAKEQGVVIDRSLRASHGLDLGDVIELELHGERRRLPVLGVALSPDFLLHPPHPEYVLPIPGTVAVLGVSAAAAPFFPHTQFVNEFLFRLAPGADADAVQAELLDRMILAVEAVTPLEEKPLHRISDVVLEVQAVYVPAALLVLLLVGGSLLGLTLAHNVRHQEGQIGLLLSLGHRPRDIVWPYVLPAAGIALTGGLLGIFGHEVYADLIVRQHVEAFGFAPPRDPGPGLALPGIVLACVGVAVVAAMLPVLHATRQPPLALLRRGPTRDARGAFFARGVARLAEHVRLPSSVTLGLANTWRQRASTFLAILSLGAAFALVIAFTCLQATNRAATMRTVQRMGLDTVVYFEGPVGADMAGRLTAMGATHVEPFISRQVLLRADDTELAWTVTGIAPDSWIRGLPIAEGRALEDPWAPELVVDRWLARKLGVRVGDRMLCFPYPNAPEGIGVEVVGILDGTTLGLGLMPLEIARSLYEMPGQQTAFHVASNRTSDALDAALGRLPGVEAVIPLTLARAKALEAFEPLDLILRLQILTAIAVAVVYLGVLAALDAATRGLDVAVLRALGWRDRAIFGLLTTEVVARGALALALAIPLSLGIATWLIARIEEANGYPLALETPVWIYVATVLAALVAIPLGAWPAWRIARKMTPAHAIRVLSR